MDPERNEYVKVRITFDVTVERESPSESDESVEAYVHDAISGWFPEDLAYEANVVND